ncbi:MAG: acetate uptake transporter [Candidatus Dormibacteraeota bacterium]|nr:acetate uptake transporter [Candidatus Dormibacteraeota bacterium]
MVEPRSAVPPAPGPGPAPLPVADPAPLGLAAFALTTFVLSVHNVGWAPDIIWVGLALFYGGLVQLLAGMQEFKNRNVFGATAFSTYGGFWLSLGIYVVLIFAVPALLKGAAGSTGNGIDDGVGWFLLAFAIFNTYMLFWSTRVSKAVFLVFLTLEITAIILFIGGFQHQGPVPPATTGFTWVNLGGLLGILTALTAWYASAAGVVNGQAGRVILPTGAPFWK